MRTKNVRIFAENLYDKEFDIRNDFNEYYTRDTRSFN